MCDSPEAVLEALESLPECGEAVVVERDGKPIGAMIPMKDLALYQRLFFDREMELDLAAVDRAKAEGGETIPWEVVKAKLKGTGWMTAGGSRLRNSWLNSELLSTPDFA